MNAASPERYFPWDVLELDPTGDQRAIKRAYARLLRRNNPEDDAEGFQRVREAYERAQQEANWIDLDEWSETPAIETPPDGAALDEAASSGPDIAVAAEKDRPVPERPALRVEPASEPEPSGEIAAEPESPLRVEPVPVLDPLWRGPEAPEPAPAPELAAAVAEADAFDALCAAAEAVLGDDDAAQIETYWQDLFRRIDRAGIDARRGFGDWLYVRLHQFQTSRPWGNPSFERIPRAVWLTLDRQFGWAADEIKLGDRFGEDAAISVMGAVRRARGEKAETARGPAAGAAGNDRADTSNKTPWWVWWLVIWGIIAVIRLIAK